MPDHLHFLLRIKPQQQPQPQQGDHIGSPLHKIIGWFKTMTTNEYIRGVKAGHYEPFEKRFWQRGYYEHVIRSEEEYSEKWKYIDENPKNMKRDFEKEHGDYRKGTGE